MARTGCQSFETLDPLIEFAATSIPSGVSFDATIFRTGTRSLKIVPASGSAVSTVTLYPANKSFGGYCRFYIRITALPSAARILIGSNTNFFEQYIVLNSNGSLECKGKDGFGTITTICTSTTLLTDTSHWYCVELKDIATGVTAGDTILKIDQAATTSLVTSALNDYTLSMQVGATDTVAATYTAYFDDVACDDTAFLGVGAVVLSVPISDNARGGWTAGAGGTTSLFDANNNLPPVGLAAASETNASQIKNAVSSTTDNCDFNMQTYTTAGVPSGATVNAVMAVVSHGEEIATGTKTGALKIVSNPTQSGENGFTFGNDVGALGTYPTNWQVFLGTAISGSGVTLGTSPVVRVGKRTASTRVVGACFVGLYIDYTPAPTNQTASPGVGSLVFTGLAPTVVQGIKAYADVGALSLTGLSPTPVINVRAQTDVGALTLTGLAPVPTSTNNQSATVGLGSLVLTGLVPSISQTANQRALTDIGSLLLAGFSPTPTSSDNKTAATDVGALVLAGLAPSAQLGMRALTDVGALVLAGLSPTTVVSNNQRALTDLGALILSGLSPTPTSTDNKQALTDLGSLILAGLSPSVVVGFRAYPDVGALTLTGFAPASNSTQNALTQTGQLALDGFAPLIVVGGNTFALTDLGQLLLSGFSPTVVQTNNQRALTDLGALILSGLAPTVAQSDNQRALTGVGSLLLAGFSPSVVQTNNQFVIPGIGQLILTGLAPSITQTNNKFALTDVAILIIDGFAPMVVIASIEDPSLSYGGQFYPSSDYY